MSTAFYYYITPAGDRRQFRHKRAAVPHADKEKANHVYTAEGTLVWCRPGHEFAEKRCSKCKAVKPISGFRACLRNRDGLLGKCISCERQVARNFWRELPAEVRLWRSARYSAKKNGVPFTITPADIRIPPICPALGLIIDQQIKGARSDNCPSIDRIVPSRGYTPDNIVIVSWRANRLKNNATIRDLTLLFEFYSLFEESNDAQRETQPRRSNARVKRELKRYLSDAFQQCSAGRYYP